MIKTIEEIKDQEEFKQFQNALTNYCEIACKGIDIALNNLDIALNSKFINMKEVREEIKNLIMEKLTVKVPEYLISEVPVMNAEKESKKTPKKSKK